MAEEASVALRLTGDRLDRASEAVGRAFRDDPFLEYLVPDEARRARLSPSFFGKTLRYGLLYGEVYTNPAVEGAVCWLPPGDSTTTIFRMLRTGLLTESLKFGWSGFRRLVAVGNYIEEVQKQSMPGPHWYLWVLGVEPSRQGQGVGGALVRPVLEQAEADGLPCYLETMNDMNIPFYRKHGFEVVRDGGVPGLKVWSMARAPRG